MKRSQFKSTSYDITSWEVPKYKILFQGKKIHQSCVVIPVINEGNRINNLLQRMLDYKINALADIIIVDGGSVDNSINQKDFKNMKVNTLLLKTGFGKLSSQLRCAYAYALMNGYNSVITIDGNNKDDPKTIPAIIQKLNEGNDFVQVSRFIKNGKGVNTPLKRMLAIRLIHAPLISLSSGFHWTDTTQGFRGYSARLLFSAELKIFRSIFTSYELLYYLSVEAPRLGFKCIEVPSKRVYPQGKVPTKISSLKGNFEMLLTLTLCCLRFYKPKA